MFYRKININGIEFPLAVNLSGPGEPTEYTYGDIGMFYMNEENGDVYKKTAEGWVIFGGSASVPTKVSQLENDAGFITKADTVYDTIIHSQEEWEEMTATEDWNGARNILLMTDISIRESTSPRIAPSSVLCIDGNGHTIAMSGAEIAAQEGSRTSLRNIKFISYYASIRNINGIYDCDFCTTGRDYIQNCKNIIGCTFSLGGGYEAKALRVEDCDTVIPLDSQELSDKNWLYFINCTNLIFDGAYVTPSDLETAIGDINAVLDELHNYAQALIAGGVSE